MCGAGMSAVKGRTASASAERLALDGAPAPALGDGHTRDRGTRRETRICAYKRVDAG
jgi:hypothetical protein